MTQKKSNPPPTHAKPAAPPNPPPKRGSWDWLAAALLPTVGPPSALPPLRCETPMPPVKPPRADSLTEADIRRIVREELDTFAARLRAGGMLA
jgi:hypothetical protein